MITIVILIVLSTIFIFDGLWLLNEEYKYLKRFSDKTTAIVVSKVGKDQYFSSDEGDDSLSYYYYIYISYSQDGRKYEKQCKVIDEYYPLFYINDEFEIKYNPSNADEIVFDGYIPTRKDDSDDTNIFLTSLLVFGGFISVFFLLILALELNERKVAKFQAFILLVLGLFLLIIALV